MPINSTAVLVLIIMFVALMFALVSSTVDEEVKKLIGLSNDHAPDDVSLDGNGFHDDKAEGVVDRVSFSGSSESVSGVHA